MIVVSHYFPTRSLEDAEKIIIESLIEKLYWETFNLMCGLPNKRSACIDKIICYLKLELYFRLGS